VREKKIFENCIIEQQDAVVFQSYIFIKKKKKIINKIFLSPEKMVGAYPPVAAHLLIFF
jgi:hypothetical protein